MRVLQHRRKAFAPAGPGGPEGTVFVTGQTLGTVRSDFTGEVGFRVTFAGSVTITHLGRWVKAGNSGTHAMRLVNGSAVTIAGVTATVNTSGASAGAFAYAALAAPVVVSAGTYYLI